MSPRRSVFILVFPVYPRDWQGSRDYRAGRYRARIFTRGTGSEIYTGSARSTRDESLRLARAWLSRRPEYVDTSTTVTP